MGKIYVIFPMAGEGARFGYVFKPFLRATELTFIELAKSSFDVLKEKGYNIEYIFAYRKIQEDQYNVESKLRKMFTNEVIHTCIIDTSHGPLQTLQQTVKDMNLKSSAFVCDCDHMLNIIPMIPYIDKELESSNYDVLVPTWNIEPYQYPSFGKVRADKYNKPLQFVEKENISKNEDENIYGILGCYYFPDISIVNSYSSYADISSMLKDMLYENKNIQLVKIDEASFFGTPKQLEDFRFQRAKTYSLFLDVDGILVHQETKELLVGVKEKIEEWKESGHSIILTSASSADYVKEICKKYNLLYDKIISDLSPGPRIIVNDSKPYIPFYRMADGISLPRNTSINQIDINQYKPPLIIKKFNGASFAKTYLVEKDKTVFVRKHIQKIDSNNEHVITLRRQYDDLQRWGYLSPNIVPKILDYHESTSHLYFDMEYLENYETLSTYDDNTKDNVLYSIINKITTDIYCFKKQIINKQLWIEKFLNIKVFPKIENISKNNENLKNLLIHNGITINNVRYNNLSEMFLSMSYNNLGPDYEGMIHGDLTLENILYNSKLNDTKVIDHAGSRYIDALEMDIGKLFQSLLCSYHTWDEACMNVIAVSPDNYIIPKSLIIQKETIINKFAWLKLYNDDISLAYDRGVFFMTTYFVRMLPFFIAKSEKHATLLILLSHIYLGQLHSIYKL